MKKYKTVDEFLVDLEPEKLKQVSLLREVILNSEPKLIETLKWNAPNYVYDGVDRITFNLMNKQNKVKILIHMGVKRKEDKSGRPILDNVGDIVEWNSNIRGTISFNGIEDIENKRNEFIKIVKDWLSLNIV